MLNLIFQAYKTLEDINVTGINAVLIASSEAVWFFPALILFAMFIILTFGSYYSSMRRIGRGDLSGSFAVAGFTTVIIAILFSLIPNFINGYILTTTIILEILFITWLWISRE